MTSTSTTFTIYEQNKMNLDDIFTKQMVERYIRYPSHKLFLP